mgnify:CR=1 FL=1
MPYSTKNAAYNSLSGLVSWLRKKHQIVPSRYWSLEQERWVRCWAVVYYPFS